MTSAISPPRNAFAEVSPRTHLIASTMLDLPHPFGPTIPVTPEWKSITVLSANDLKPCNCKVLRTMVQIAAEPAEWTIHPAVFFTDQRCKDESRMQDYSYIATTYSGTTCRVRNQLWYRPGRGFAGWAWITSRAGGPGRKRQKCLGWSGGSGP